jgi:hypothetical protein
MLTAVTLQEQKTWQAVKKTISLDIGALVAEVEDDPTAKTKIWTSMSNAIPLDHTKSSMGAKK